MAVAQPQGDRGLAVRRFSCCATRRPLDLVEAVARGLEESALRLDTAFGAALSTSDRYKSTSPVLPQGARLRQQQPRLVQGQSREHLSGRGASSACGVVCVEAVSIDTEPRSSPFRRRTAVSRTSSSTPVSEAGEQAGTPGPLGPLLRRSGSGRGESCIRVHAPSDSRDDRR